jgi:hypothetical protein
MKSVTGYAKRVSERVNRRLQWTSNGFLWRNQRFDYGHLPELLEAVFRATGCRLEPTLVPIDSEDSILSDHAEDEEEGDEAERSDSEDGVPIERTTARYLPKSAAALACRHCDRRFDNRSNLTRHGNAVHRKIKFRCPSCGRDFSRSDPLKRHARDCAQ